MNNQDSYQVLFSEILNGYSLVSHTKFGVLYIKHYSYSETGTLDAKYNLYLLEATSKGIPTYKQREKQILLEGIWSQDEDIELVSYQSMIDNMRINYTKEFLHSRRQQIKKNIDANLLALDRLTIKKNYCIGSTAEAYANKKMTYNRIVYSYFKDINCSIPLIKVIPEEEDELDDNDYSELISLFNQSQERLGGDNIKKIALSPFFSNLFSLCSENAYNFYGKPVVNLTNYQVNLFIFGFNFKHIISQYGVMLTDDVKSNPEALLETIEMRQNAKTAGMLNDDEGKGGSMSIVGATKEDYKKLGIILPESNRMQQELRKKGTLTKEDLFALEG